MILKKHRSLFVLALTIFAFILNCEEVSQNELSPTNNAGGYALNNTSSKGTRDSVLISGVVKDVQSLSPIYLKCPVGDFLY